ncbi:MAG TPA: PAS domain-containing protein [Vicinamibacterales bacterium]
MNAPSELADEVGRLRGCLNDLVGVMALPALWPGREPLQIVTPLADALLAMLNAAFVVVRWHDPERGQLLEIVRVDDAFRRSTTPDIVRAIEDALGDARPDWAERGRLSIGGEELSVASAGLGPDNVLGSVIVGARGADFPAQTERLLLDVAANQAAIGLQHARLLGDQKRYAAEIDRRVVVRTRELAASNARLEREVRERRQVEEALREQERESRLVVDSLPGLVAILTASGELAGVNDRVVEYCGRSELELREWATNDTIHPDDRPRIVQHFAGLITSGLPSGWEARIRRADGVYRWFQFRALPLRDPAGRIVRWYGLLTDIDDRKRAESLLAGEKRLLEMVASGSALSAVLETLCRLVEEIDPKCRCGVNLIDQIATAFEASPAPWLAASVSDPVVGHPATSTPILSLAGEVLGTFAIYQRDQATPVDVHRDLIGQVAHLASIAIERTRNEVELRRAYDHLTQAQRLSQTGSFTADLERDEHFWSEEFYRICEFEPGSPVTIQRLGEIVHPEDVPLYEGAIGRAMAGTDPDFYFRIVTARGVVKHLRGFAHRIADRPVFVGAVQDVTASKMAQEALNKAGAELAYVSRLTTLSALTASIAHEVNQPLSGIITNAGACLRMLDAASPDVAGARETARRTIRDGNRAAEVIARLRALFSKRDFTLEPLDLNEATRELIALSSNDLQRHRVILHCELADGLPLVAGDRIQLQQVILNLLRNAADAMADVHDRPRLLTIRTEHDDDDRVRVAVRDAGVGLPVQSANAVFEAFYTTKSGGMGIGLFVSRSIVERHGGRLWGESNEGGPGATFAFSLPTVNRA